MHCNKLKTTGEFIKTTSLKYDNKYDYSKVNYVNARTKVSITCEEHGDFSVTPNNHLRGRGCKQCGINERVKIKVQSYLKLRNWNFEQPEEYKLIPVGQSKYAIVDNEDFDRLKDVNWHLTKAGYIKNDVVGYIHRFILNAPKGLEVDHENGNKLDNRKTNIRICTTSLNGANKFSYKGSSKYKGVCWDKIKGMWLVQLSHEGVKYNLGHYTVEEEAGRAYDLKSLELRGEFAHRTLNFPELLTTLK